MLEYAAAFLAVGLFFFNLDLALEKKSFLLVEKVSADGWTHSCKYYKPVSTITIKRPIQIPCLKFETF